MTAIISKHPFSSVRTTPVIALKHPSYRGPGRQAAAALVHLSELYRLKKKRSKTAGHA
jgi:hypothetical protein